VVSLSGERGSVTLIGAVSPPGGDFSEPVTSHTKEIVQTFWALSKELADARHYPAVDWTDSFSENVSVAAGWWADEVDPSWMHKRGRAMALLTEADELSRIVNLVGSEALSSAQRWNLESAMLIKEGVLQQSALEAADSYASPAKQYALLELMLAIHERGAALLEIGIPVRQLLAMPVLVQARRCKSVYSSEQVEDLQAFGDEVHRQFDKLHAEYAGAAQST
jgi:V/A-type H+-transporting ATPase subunit A